MKPTFELADEQTKSRPNILGGVPMQVNSNINWRGHAMAAFEVQVHSDRLTRQLLYNELALRLETMLGVNIPINGSTIPEIVVDGLKFSIREAPRRKKEQREFYIFAHLLCGFCGRDTPKQFDTFEQLGELLASPTGDCQHCHAPLAARQTRVEEGL